MFKPNVHYYSIRKQTNWFRALIAGLVSWPSPPPGFISEDLGEGQLWLPPSQSNSMYCSPLSIWNMPLLLRSLWAYLFPGTSFSPFLEVCFSCVTFKSLEICTRIISYTNRCSRENVNKASTIRTRFLIPDIGNRIRYFVPIDVIRNNNVSEY